MWHMDEPIGDSAVLPSYLLSRFASKHVKVILNGLGVMNFLEDTIDIL